MSRAPARLHRHSGVTTRSTLGSMATGSISRSWRDSRKQSGRSQPLVIPTRDMWCRAGYSQGRQVNRTPRFRELRLHWQKATCPESRLHGQVARLQLFSMCVWHQTRISWPHPRLPIPIPLLRLKSFGMSDLAVLAIGRNRSWQFFKHQ
jgi:hypothetical protein